MRSITPFFPLAFLALSPGCATETQGAPDQSKPLAMRAGGPPPEAFTACESWAEGDICTIVTPQRSLSGLCVIGRQSSALVCVPDRNDRHRPNQVQHGGLNQHPLHDRRIVRSGSALTLYPAIVPPLTESQINETVEGEWRILQSNSISDHLTGAFPNPGNPNTITEFTIEMRVPANPVHTGQATPVKDPGLALNGVSFDPGAGEFYRGDPSLGWQYEALSGAIDLGLDDNHAHVQPTGKYHYHGLPTGLMEELSIDGMSHSKQVGWAADGFPIYARYGYANADGTQIKDMSTSYRLKSGTRPTAGRQPGGVYDGTFTADYEYVRGLGDLDECNGKLTITPDFPDGTYAYFIATNYPVVPRCLMGTIDPNSRRRGPPPGQRRSGHTRPKR